MTVAILLVAVAAGLAAAMSACRGRPQAALVLIAAPISAGFIVHVVRDGDQFPLYQLLATIGLGNPWLGVLGLAAIALIASIAAGSSKP